MQTAHTHTHARGDRRLFLQKWKSLSLLTCLDSMSTRTRRKRAHIKFIQKWKNALIADKNWIEITWITLKCTGLAIDYSKYFTKHASRIFIRKTLSTWTANKTPHVHSTIIYTIIQFDVMSTFISLVHFQRKFISRSHFVALSLSPQSSPRWQTEIATEESTKWICFTFNYMVNGTSGRCYFLLITYRSEWLDSRANHTPKTVEWRKKPHTLPGQVRCTLCAIQWKHE